MMGVWESVTMKSCRVGKFTMSKCAEENWVRKGQPLTIYAVRAVRCLELLSASVSSLLLFSSILIRLRSPPSLGRDPLDDYPFVHAICPRLSTRYSLAPPFFRFFRRDTPQPLHVRGVSDAPNILLDKSAYHPFLLHFPCRECLNPQLRRQSARDAARPTLSTADGPEFVRADATATRKCKNTDS